MWLDRQKTYLQDWDEFLVSTAEGPFEGSSSLHLPLTLIVTRALHARFLQALLGVEPYFNLKARTEGFQDRTDLVSDTLGYAFKTWANYNQGVESAIDTWVWNWVSTGTGLLKQRWDVRYESFVDVVEEVVQAMPTGATDASGAEQLQPKQETREVEKRITKKWFEGPVFECIPAEDILIIGGDGDPQIADSVHHTQWMTASELWTLVDRKIFDEAAVETVIDGGPDNKVGRPGTDIKQDRALHAGHSSVDTEADLDRYEITESYINYDVDGSGINSKIVLWHARKAKVELRATYLRRVNKAGEVPIYKIDFHKRPGQTYGVGIVEMMYSIAKEMDAIHNMRVDSGILSNMPIGFYRPTSSINPETIQLSPGAMIPVDNPQTDIVFPQMGNKTSYGFQEEAALQSLARETDWH
jgi:hypothetical protein